MTDKDMVNGIINQNENALQELKSKYGKLIYGVINKVLSNTLEIVEIDECFNDVLFSIWNNIDCYDEHKGELRNFLISISKYRALDYKRKMFKEKICLELNDEIIGNVVASSNIEDEIDVESFYTLINGLKESDKVIFIRRYFLDESIEKIALDLGISKDAIYKRLSRGRDKIRETIIK